MKRHLVRTVLTLILTGGFLATAPATSEAGIIPWAYDAVFGPVGSLQAHRAQRMYGPTDGCCGSTFAYGASYGGGYYGAGSYGNHRPGLFGRLRGWRGGCGSCGVPACGGCSTCGDCNTCGVGGGCASGNCGVDAYAGANYGYGGGNCANGNCSTGNCANGNCATFYPPIPSSNSNVPSSLAPANPNAVAPVAPAAPIPAATPMPTYDAPMNRINTNDGFGPAPDGFRPSGTSPAPTPVAPEASADQFIPPRNNSPAAPTATSENEAIPAEKPSAPGRPRPTFGEDDDAPMTPKKEEGAGKAGPRLELHDKIAWNRTVSRSRQVLEPVPATASVVRVGMFPKARWVSETATVAKK